MSKITIKMTISTFMSTKESTLMRTLVNLKNNHCELTGPTLNMRMLVNKLLGVLQKTKQEKSKDWQKSIKGGMCNNHYLYQHRKEDE